MMAVSTTPELESAQRWLAERLSKEHRILNASELAETQDHTPVFWVDDMDGAYREGFEEGFDYCVERFEEMYGKRGFVRVREIANILWHWSDSVLRPWRYFGNGMYRNHEQHHPIHKQDESWADIRDRILRRDQKCTRCGDVLKLEVDHIVDVQDGGRPEDKNLRTLCRVCHKGKSIWSKEQGYR